MLQSVNSQYAVYDKHTGIQIQDSKPLAFLFNTYSGVGAYACGNASEYQTDPVVVYDQFANRWLVSYFASAFVKKKSVSPFYICLAISQTCDATGLYHNYAFESTDSTDPSISVVPDYPKLAVWSDAY